MNTADLLKVAVKAPRPVSITIAVIFSAFVLVMLVGLVVFISRWKKVRGATSRYDAYRRAFGEKGAKRVFVGIWVYAGVCFVLAILYKTQHWR